jgi:hypothetical protein
MMTHGTHVRTTWVYLRDTFLKLHPLLEIKKNLFIVLPATHHAEGLVNPKVRALKKVTDFGYPRASRFRKHQILNRSPEVPLPTLKKT